MAIEKFMFDRSFDVGGPKADEAPIEEVPEVEAEPEIVVPTFSEAELETAKQEAFAKGKEEALGESATAIEAQIVEATKLIGEKLDALVVGQLLANKDIFADAIKVSQAITKKAFPLTTVEQGTAEIEAVLRQVLVQVLEEPRVGIHVNPAIESLLVERIDQIAAETHFDGRLYVTADEAIEEGDCKIEWSSGGAERNLAALIAQADEIIEANLSSLDGGYVPTTDPDALDELEQDRRQRAEERESNEAETQQPEPNDDKFSASEASEPDAGVPETAPTDVETPPQEAISEPLPDTPKNDPEPQDLASNVDTLDVTNDENTDLPDPEVV